MPSQARSWSPDGSFHGIPVSCTRRPGAWPTISRRAVGAAMRMGRGGYGRRAAQTLQARTRASSWSKVSAAPGSAGVVDDELLDRIDVGVHEVLLLRLRFQIRQFGRAHRIDAERLADRVLELGGLRGFHADQRHAGLAVLEPDLEAVGGVRVDHGAVHLVHGADGVHAVSVAARTGDHAEVGDAAEQAVRLEVEAAARLDRAPQAADL